MTEKSKKLSICIPTYNKAECIEAMVKNLISEGIEEFSDMELIVADDCSKDDTVERIENLGAGYENIRFIANKENLGLAGNINLLLSLAKGQYVWFPGQDDIFVTGILSKLHPIIQNDNYGHIFINHSLYRDGETVNEKLFTGTGGHFEDGIEMFEYVVNNSITGFGTLMFMSANIFRRELVIEALGILTKKGEADNPAIPLGYSLFSSSLPGYIVEEVYVVDDTTSCSWDNIKYLVGAREEIAILDILASEMGCGRRIRKLILNNLPIDRPELGFIKYKKKKNIKKDNYALKMYLKHFPWIIVKDMCDVVIGRITKVN